MKLRKLALSTLATWSLTLLPAHADLLSNLQHTPKAPDGFVSLSTNYEDWKYFLSKKPFATAFNQTLKSIAPELEKELGMNFEKDLVPMIGTHLSLAYYQKEFSKTETVPLLLVFDLKNTGGFPKLITRLKDIASKDKDKGKQVQTSTYKGITLYGFVSARRTEGVPYMALSNHTLLIGSKGLVSKAIDAAQQKTSALADANFKSMYEVLKANKLWTYVTPEMINTSLNVDEIVASAQTTKTSLKDNLNQYQSLGFGLDLNPNGLMIKTLAKFKSNQAPAQKALIQSFAKIWNDPKVPMLKILQGSPAKPLMMFAFNGMHLYQQSLQLFGGQDPDTKKLMDEMAVGFRQFSGLDFQQDLIKYSDGRGGVVIFYPENTKIFDRAPHLVTYMGVKDIKGFQSVLQNKFKLNLPAENSGQDQKKPPIQIQFPKKSNSSYRGYPLFIAQENPEAKKLKDAWFVQPAYSQVGDVWVFSSNPDGLKAALDQLSGQKSSLIKNSYFQNLSSKHKMQLNGGVFYMDLSAAMKLVEFLGGADPEVKQLKPTLNAFKSIMGGSRMVNDMAEGTFVVDVDMDKIDYELLAKIFNLMGGKDLGKPKAKVNTQPQVKPTAPPTYRPANNPPRPVVKHQVGL